WFLRGGNAGFHSPLLQDPPQKQPPEQHLEQPRHSKREAVERSLDEVSQVVTGLSKIPLAQLLEAAAMQLLYLREHLGKVLELQSSGLHGCLLILTFTRTPDRQPGACSGVPWMCREVTDVHAMIRV